MKERLFNVFYVLCGLWIAILLWNWFGLIGALTAPVVLILAAIPLAFVVAARYLAG